MRRLGLSLLLVVVIAVVGAGWFIDQLFNRLNKPDQAVSAAEVIGAQLAAQIDSDQRDLVALPEALGDNNYKMRLISSDSMALPEALQEQLDSGHALALESEQGVALHFGLPLSKRVLIIELPEPNSPDTRLRLLLTLLFYAAIACLILMWLYPLVRRLQRLAVAAKLFGEGDLRQRIATRPQSQIYDIESEFNRMAQRIQGLVDDNKMLCSAVSHDLRTPLARLRFGVDALAEQATDSLHINYIERISVDLESMEQLVEVLLEFARLDQQLTELPLRLTPLVPLVEQCVQLHLQSTHRSLKLINQTTGPQIMAEARYTQMLINNLLQNALKFSANQVRVTVGHSVGKVWVHVEDDGPGFIDKDRDRLLKPFEKGARTQSVEDVRGYG